MPTKRAKRKAAPETAPSPVSITQLLRAEIEALADANAALRERLDVTVADDIRQNALAMGELAERVIRIERAD